MQKEEKQRLMDPSTMYPFYVLFGEGQWGYHGCGSPWIPGNVRGQLGQGSEHPGLMEGVPAQVRGFGMK